MRRIALAAALLLQGPALAHHGTGHGRPVTATVYDSWYADRPTYCGGAYRHWGVSAAHPWLPCGTRVTVRHGSRVLTVPIAASAARSTCQLAPPGVLASRLMASRLCRSVTDHGPPWLSMV